MPRKHPAEQTLTIDRALALRHHQRPGVRIIMGVYAARDVLVAPASEKTRASLPGPDSWLDYDYLKAWNRAKTPRERAAVTRQYYRPIRCAAALPKTPASGA